LLLRHANPFHRRTPFPFGFAGFGICRGLLGYEEVFGQGRLGSVIAPEEERRERGLDRTRRFCGIFGLEFAGRSPRG
jgi:hypothetical protein